MKRLVESWYNDTMNKLEPLISNETTYNDDLNKNGKLLFGNSWRGVHASDKLPNIKNGQMYIANLDKSTEPGSHWVGVYKEDNKLYVYDSFGRESSQILPSIFKKHLQVLDTEHDAEQAKAEDNCGLRSMTALWMLKNLEANYIYNYL